jgi:hypothetical protein
MQATTFFGILKMVLITPEAMEAVAREMLRQPNQRKARLTEKQTTGVTNTNGQG